MNAGEREESAKEQLQAPPLARAALPFLGFLTSNPEIVPKKARGLLLKGPHYRLDLGGVDENAHWVCNYGAPS